MLVSRKAYGLARSNAGYDKGNVKTYATLLFKLWLRSFVRLGGYANKSNL